MPGRKQAPIKGINIGGNVTITNGDFVAGNKLSKIQIGSIADSNNQSRNSITGDRNRIGNVQPVANEIFGDFYRKIEKRPKTSAKTRKELKASVEIVQAETQKGNKANQPFLMEQLKKIGSMAPDIAEVILAALISPVNGFAAVIRKVAERAQKH